MTGRTLLKAAVISALLTLSQFLQSRFSLTDNLPVLGLLVAAFFVVVVLIEFASSRIDQRDFTAQLAQVLNSSARTSKEVTTVGEFLSDSPEAELTRGDRVEILTNSLRGYDLTSPALNIIATNLKRGVSYVYYLPNLKENPDLKNELGALLSGLLSVTEDRRPSPDEIRSLLKVRVIRDSCLYNFATITSSKLGTLGYWYITSPTGTVDKSELIIMSLGLDLRDKLMSVLRRVEERANEYNLFELQPGGTRRSLSSGRI